MTGDDEMRMYVLLLMLVMPAALLLMICVLGRYERLIDAPVKGNEAARSESSRELALDATELTAELAPEAA